MIQNVQLDEKLKSISFPFGSADGEIFVYKRWFGARSIPDTPTAICKAENRLAGCIMRLPFARRIGRENRVVGVFLPMYAVGAYRKP